MFVCVCFGCVYVGEIVCLDIGVFVPLACDLFFELVDVSCWFVWRVIYVYKGSAGHVLIVVGLPGCIGVVILVGHVVLCVGVGLCLCVVWCDWLRSWRWYGSVILL